MLDSNMFAINVNTVEMFDLLKSAQANEEIKKLYYPQEESQLLATRSLLVEAIRVQL